MRYYLASRYGRREELREYAAELIALGHLVTSRWLFETHEGNESDDTPEQHALNHRFMLEDLHDVFSADMMITFGEDPIDTTNFTDSDYADIFGYLVSAGRGGRHVELGWALAFDKPIVLVGTRQNLFYYSPTITVAANWAEAREIATARIIWRRGTLVPAILQGIRPYNLAANENPPYDLTGVPIFGEDGLATEKLPLDHQYFPSSAMPKDFRKD